jgi:hypothetical protein
MVGSAIESGRHKEGQPRRLTAGQQRFVDEYMTDFNATAAAIRAGQSAKSAHHRTTGPSRTKQGFEVGV